jgi:hypothetical protein
MRAKKIRWAAIADALNKQGVYPDMEGQADTLTTNRLTAIVSTLERQDAKKQTRAATRQMRTGLVAPERRNRSLSTSVTLSPELQRPAKKSGDTAAAYESEDALRRRALAAVQPFLKDPL